MTAFVMLDIDGVVTTARHTAAMGRNAIDPAACGLVNDLLAATGALVVVSSTWRRDADCRALLLAAGLHDRFAPHWRTEPWPDPDALADPDRPRGSEIDLYVRTHGVVDYVILDDDPAMLDHQRARHVATCTAKGLYPHHVDLAIAVLRGSAP